MPTNSPLEIPYLSNLGIPFNQQAVTPTENAFPVMFNPQNKAIWDLSIRELKTTKSAANDWALAIHSYIMNCEHQGRYPFTNLKQSVNDQIVEELQVARTAVVKFINHYNLLKMITFRDTHRKVTMTNNGFVLSVQGAAKLKDPTFPEWLTHMPGPRFDIIRNEDGKWSKTLSSNTTFFAYNEGAKLIDRWHIGYEIVINKFPDIPNHATPSKLDLERFILDILWMPVLKQQRPIGLSHKLL